MARLLLALMFVLITKMMVKCELQVGYYSSSCAEAESIVHQVVFKTFRSNPAIAASLIRMHFHDCFVQGCDGSILIDSTPENTAEKDAPANNPSLTGYDIIDEAKRSIEAICPGVVSCADILAFAARDSSKLAGGISWDVKGGRRDGRISRAPDVATNLPPPTFDVNQLTKRFAEKGLTQEEMVTLSGAHSIGKSLCSSFANRLYNFSETTKEDPSLDFSYATILKTRCPQGTSSNSNTQVSMEPLTPTLLDNLYYSGVVENRGLFTSDQTLMSDASTANMVLQNSVDGMLWAKNFASAMIRMGDIGVLTSADQGEIRLNCRVVNPS